jgi:hypothetical protein
VGSTTIRARSEGIEDTVAVTVGANVYSLDPNPTTFDITDSTTADIVITARDIGGNPLAGRTLTPVSEDPAIATAAMLGVTDVAGQATLRITGQSAGLTTIEVTADTASVEIDGEVTAGGGPEADMVSTFTAPNGTDLHGWLCDTGQAYIVYAGTWDINNNRARKTSAQSDQTAGVPCGSANGRYEIDIPLVGAENSVLKTDVAVRMSGPVDYIQFGPKSNNLAFAQAWSRVADSWTMLAEQPCAWGVSVRVGCDMDGNILDFDVDGVPIITGLNESFNNTAQVHGMSCHGPAEYDNAEFVAA